MLRLVGHVAAEVPPDDAVPGGIVLLVKLLKNTQKRESGTKGFNIPVTPGTNGILT